jgi:hypothetical protein
MIHRHIVRPLKTLVGLDDDIAVIMRVIIIIIIIIIDIFSYVVRRWRLRQPEDDDTQ